MDIYELIGFIIGDGNIYYSKEKRKYRLELCGNIEEDYDYFKKLNNFLYEFTNKKPLMFKRKEIKGNSLRIQFNNKEFVEKLIKLGLPSGKKTFTIKISEEIINNREFMISLVRGLFEADGCLYFSKIKNKENPTYPRIEIKTSSIDLANQIKIFLKNEGFNVYIKESKTDKTISLILSGKIMLEKWKSLIGLNSEKNASKYHLWKTKGFYIPHTNLKNRKKLCADGTSVLRPIFN